MRTFITASLIALTLASPLAQEANSVKTRYYLPKTVITVSGVVTTKATFPQDPNDGMGKASETNQVTVNIATVPDGAAALFLSTESALLSKTTTSIDLTATGLLTGVNSKSEGQLGTIVKNIFSAVVSLATAAAGLKFAGESPAEKMYFVEAADAARRRRDLKGAVVAAAAQLVIEQRKIATSQTVELRKATKAQIADLKESLADLRAELVGADVAFEAWKSRREDAKEKRFEMVFDVDDLPPNDGIRTLAEAATNPTMVQVEQAAGPFASHVAGTRVLVTQSALPAAPAGTPKAETVSTAINYRALRPTILSVYTLDGNNKPVLMKQTVEFVAGRLSQVASFPVFNSKWSTKSLAVTFSGAAITKVSTETGSDVAAASEALKSLPAEFIAAVKVGNEVVAEHAKIAQTALQVRIDQLKQEKAFNEAKIASGESLDMTTMKARADRIDAEIALLDKERLLTAAHASGADVSAVTLQKQLIELQNSLIQAQTKQIEFQLALEEMRKKVAGGGGGV